MSLAGTEPAHLHVDDTFACQCFIAASFEKEAVAPLATAQFVFVGCVQLENASELCADCLGADTVTDDRTLVIRLATKFGLTGLASRIKGEFAFVIWDRGSREAFCFRDRLGIKSLYFSKNRGTFACASAPWILLNSGFCTTDLNQEHLNNVLIHCRKPFASKATAFANVDQVKPGHCAQAKSGEVRQLSYWHPEATKPLRLTSEAEYAERFRDLLGQAVAARLPTVRRVWFDLSGGVDSTSIVCLAKRRLGMAAVDRMRLRTISHPDLPEFSAGEFIECALRHLGLPARFESFDRSTPITAVFAPGYPPWDEPWFGHVLYSETKRFCLAVLEDGAADHLTGYCADHLLVPSSFLYCYDLFKQRRWSRLRRDLKHWILVSKEPSLSFIYRRILRPLLSHGHRHPTSRVAPWLRGLSKATLRQRSYDDTPWRFPSVALQDHFDHICEGAITANYLAAAHAAHGVIEQFPFLDTTLLEFILAIPLEQRVRPPFPKMLLRDAMSAIVPDEIRHRTRQPQGSIPVMYKLRSSQTQIRHLLNTGMLADMRMIEPGITDSYFSRLLQGDTRYIVQFLTTLASELWVRRLAPAARGI